MPPANDAFADAAAVPGLPFSASLSTAEATSAPDDPSCAGEDAASVWFAYTPPVTAWLTADTFGSDYDTTLSAYTGGQGALVQVACNDDAGGPQSQVAFLAEGGVTYFLMAAGRAGGGALALGLDVRPPLPQLPVRATSAWEITPAAGPGVAWAQAGRRSRHWTLKLAVPGRQTVRVNRGGTSGFGGGFDGSGRLVYQEVARGRSDLLIYDPDTMGRSKPRRVNSRHWEWHPTMTDDWILFSRRDFRARRDVILLANRRGGWPRVLGRVQRAGGSRIGEAGQVSGGYAVWYTCTPRCDVYLRDIAAKKTTRIPNPGRRQQYDPSVTSDGTVYFVQSGRGCGKSVRLVRRPLGGPSRTLVSLGAGLDSFHTYAAEEADGTTSLYYERVRCRTGRSDVFRVVDP